MTKKVYDESSIEVVLVDVDKIKKRFEMYIGYHRWRAFLHLIKETLQNSVDEATEPDSGCDEIFVDYDERSKKIVIEDNGRGIPHGSIVNISTIIQSSGKFNKGDNKSYKFAAGMNGVGFTAVNALSEYCIVTSWRNGIKYRVKFKNGYLQEQGQVGTCDENRTGTRSEFKPDENIIGEAFLDTEHILNLCENMSFLAPGIKIKVHAITLNGNEINKTFKSKNGITDLLQKIAGKDTIIDPLYISFRDNDKTIEVALTYSPNVDGENIVSFANYCTTVDHGSHVTGFKQGLSNALIKYVKENCLNKTEKDKIDVVGDDCREGLIAVVNANHISPSFVGQVKEKLNNDDMIPFGKVVVSRGINEWIKNNPKHAKRLGDYVKSISKARYETQKAKQVVIKSDISAFSKDKPDKYHPGTSFEDAELIIIEGDSAGGNCKSARNPKNQHLYYLKGVPLNAYDLTLVKTLENPELRGLVTILGCGIGKNFNRNKLKFKRIIIMTDADVDGHNITSQASVFFLVHMPELVEYGYIYKAVPPLYRISERGKEIYLQNNRQYVDYVEGNIAKNAVVSRNNDVLARSEVQQLLLDNRNYLRTLTKLSNRFALNSTLLEHIIVNISDIKTMKKDIKSNFKQVKITDDKDSILIRGVVDREYQVAKINSKFIDKLKDLTYYIHDVNKGNILYDLNGRTITLGDMLKVFKQYEPNNSIRYKGLGEMEEKQLWSTTLDPERRHLVRLVSNNIAEDIRRFAVLHGRKAREERKQLISKFRIDIDDIDT